MDMGTTPPMTRHGQRDRGEGPYLRSRVRARGKGATQDRQATRAMCMQRAGSDICNRRVSRVRSHAGPPATPYVSTSAAAKVGRMTQFVTLRVNKQSHTITNLSNGEERLTRTWQTNPQTQPGKGGRETKTRRRRCASGRAGSTRQSAGNHASVRQATRGAPAQAVEQARP